MSGKTGYRKLSPSVLIQKAIALKIHCEKDKEELIAANLSWSCYDELVMLTRKVQDNYTEILLYREDRKCESAALQKFAKVCVDFRSFFRDLVVSASEYVTTGSKIPGMSRRNSYIDISQDLLLLAVSAERIVKKFPKCSITPELITRSREYSAKLFSMATRCNVLYPDKPEFSHSFEESVCQLHILIKYIRKIGKDAFREDPVRRRAYFI